MIPEDERQRRGEPVIVTVNGGEVKATIEWGGVTRPASVYCEAGGRITGLSAAELRSEPGGARPIWDKVTGGARS